MNNLTPEGLRIVSDKAGQYGLSLDAGLALLGSLMQGNGGQAQFNHPELGGMGQWSQGGMIMIGDMFNNDLKHRVSGLCNDLAGLVRGRSLAFSQSQSQGSGEAVSLFVAGSGDGGAWWPGDLGSPSSAGAQNDMRYAYFAGPRRLAIRSGGQVRVYDTGAHSITGFSQAQSGDQTLSFTSQQGLVRITDLAEVTPGANPAPVEAKPYDAPAAPPTLAAAPGSQVAGDAIFAALERLAELHKKSILSEEEFAAKKRELLSRL